VREGSPEGAWGGRLPSRHDHWSPASSIV